MVAAFLDNLVPVTSWRPSNSGGCWSTWVPLIAKLGCLLWWVSHLFAIPVSNTKFVRFLDTRPFNIASGLGTVVSLVGLVSIKVKAVITVPVRVDHMERSPDHLYEQQVWLWTATLVTVRLPVFVVMNQTQSLFELFNLETRSLRVTKSPGDLHKRCWDKLQASSYNGLQ